MGELYAWRKHKHPYARGFGPYAFFMEKRTGYFTSSTAAAL